MTMGPKKQHYLKIGTGMTLANKRIESTSTKVTIEHINIQRKKISNTNRIPTPNMGNT
jgi:hypothetical protein